MVDHTAIDLEPFQKFLCIIHYTWSDLSFICTQPSQTSQMESFLEDQFSLALHL